MLYLITRKLAITGPDVQCVGGDQCGGRPSLDMTRHYSCASLTVFLARGKKSTERMTGQLGGRGRNISSWEEWFAEL